jgi:hypothetical protein
MELNTKPDRLTNCQFQCDLLLWIWIYGEFRGKALKHWKSELHYDWWFTSNQLILVPSSLRHMTSDFFIKLNSCGLSFWVCLIWIVLASVKSAYCMYSILLKIPKSSVYVMNNGQLDSLSWYQAPIWDLRPDFYYCWTAGLLMLGKKTGLFTVFADPHQHNHSL